MNRTMCLQVDLGTQGFALTGLERIDHSWNLFVFIFHPPCMFMKLSPLEIISIETDQHQH